MCVCLGVRVTARVRGIRMGVRVRVRVTTLVRGG